MSNIKKADAKLISLSNAAVKRKSVFDKWNDTLTSKLQNLKDKIAEARNTAEGVIIIIIEEKSNVLYILQIFFIRSISFLDLLDSNFRKIDGRQKMR